MVLIDGWILAVNCEDGMVGVIEVDGFVGSNGKDLNWNEFSDLVACTGWGIARCFSVSGNNACSGLDGFASSPNAVGRGLAWLEGGDERCGTKFCMLREDWIGSAIRGLEGNCCE